MKVPPKRKGNGQNGGGINRRFTLNESPSEKEGKSACVLLIQRAVGALNESPSEKEGK